MSLIDSRAQKIFSQFPPGPRLDKCRRLARLTPASTRAWALNDITAAGGKVDSGLETCLNDAWLAYTYPDVLGRVDVDILSRPYRACLSAGQRVDAGGR